MRQAAAAGGDDFLMRVFNDPLLLGQVMAFRTRARTHTHTHHPTNPRAAQVSGVAQMAQAAEDVDVNWSEDEESEGGD